MFLDIKCNFCFIKDLLLKVIGIETIYYLQTNYSFEFLLYLYRQLPYRYDIQDTGKMYLIEFGIYTTEKEMEIISKCNLNF